MTPNAQRQATYRARYKKRTEALKAIISEMGNPTGDKGRKIIALAVEGLA